MEINGDGAETPAPMRIQRFLAECGAGSRREAERLIADGRVAINGRLAQFGDCVELGMDTVTLDGRRLERENRIYLLMNKPRGVMSGLKDPDRRPTIATYLGKAPGRVYPADQLGQDAEGGLLLTNDGGLVHELNHPECELEKTYLASVEGLMQDATIERIIRGIRIDEGPPVRAQALLLTTGLRTTLVRITLRETRGITVSRLLDTAGYPAFELRRIAIGNLHIGRLQPGEWRSLSTEEIHGLRRRMRLQRQAAAPALEAIHSTLK